MDRDRREGTRKEDRARLHPERPAHEAETGLDARNADLVFDFTDVHHPGFADLSLILTARLQARPQDRVWVRALPVHTWRVLRALGLDHLFRDYPGPATEPN